MGLKNFIKDGFYTRISQIRVNKDLAMVDFKITVFEEKGGNPIFAAPIDFIVSQTEAERQYFEQNPPSLPDGPVYPKLCADREAMVPMWAAESTQAEKEEYYTAKAQYDTDFAQWQSDCQALISKVRADAKTKNDFVTFFPDEKLYIESNPTACAYSFLKTQKGFEEAVDVFEES